MGEAENGISLMWLPDLPPVRLRATRLGKQRAVKLQGSLAHFGRHVLKTPSALETIAEACTQREKPLIVHACQLLHQVLRRLWRMSPQHRATGQHVLYETRHLQIQVSLTAPLDLLLTAGCFADVGFGAALRCSHHFKPLLLQLLFSPSSSV